MPGTWAPNVEGAGVDGKIAGVAAIKAHDPAFDEDVFLGEAQRRFFAVLEAWTSEKPELSQETMAPQIWEEQKAQVESYLRQGWRNVLDGLAFTSAIIAGASSEHGYDTVTVRINASSSDYDVDNTGRVLRGATQPYDWTEDWIFQQPVAAEGKATSSGPASCPNCGAPVDPDITSVCPYCKAPLAGSGSGWLLTRVDRI